MASPLLRAASAAGVDGERCREHVDRLTRFHRIIGTRGYSAAAAYIRGELAGVGITDVAIDAFPMDGVVAYGDWIAPLAWEARRAELWVESPECFPLCDYAQMPICLHGATGSTPAGGLLADLIDIGERLDTAAAAQPSLAGRVALTSGNVREVFRDVIGRGASGVISDCMPWQAPSIKRTPAELPDLVSYNRLDLRPEDTDRPVFSFGLSAAQGARVRALLAEQPVRVRAEIDAAAGAGRFEVVSTRMPGTDPSAGELVLLAHLCHPQPGANDNGTGPALILEVARALIGGWRAGDIPPFRHTVRLLFVPETYGTIAWLLARGRTDDLRMVLNLDMVGEDTEQTRGHLWLDQTPWSVPSCLNDLASLLMQETADATPGWPHGVRDHRGGSDHIMFHAPEFGVPALMLGHEPDRYYHSDQDTVDKTAAAEFARVGRIVISLLLTIDRLGISGGRDLITLVERRGAGRISAFAKMLTRRATEADAPPGDEASAMAVLSAKEQAAVRSVEDLAVPEHRAAVQQAAQRSARRLGDLAAGAAERIRRPRSPTRPPALRDPRVVSKIFAGPISSHLMGRSRFLEALGPSAMRYRSLSNEDRTFVCWMTEACNLMNGQRSLAEIADVLAAEFDGDRAYDLVGLTDDLLTVGMATLT